MIKGEQKCPNQCEGLTFGTLIETLFFWKRQNLCEGLRFLTPLRFFRIREIAAKAVSRASEYEQKRSGHFFCKSVQINNSNTATTATRATTATTTATTAALGAVLVQFWASFGSMLGQLGAILGPLGASSGQDLLRGTLLTLQRPPSVVNSV